MDEYKSVVEKNSIKDEEPKPTFQYSMSNILKNLYDAFTSKKITLDEKSDLKTLIFSKNPAITNIFEQLKDPKLFSFHLNFLKNFLITSKSNEEAKASEGKNFDFLNIKKNLKLDKFNSFETPGQESNTSLLMDPNESIIFIEKTNQNFFSEEEAENLSTTLGLDMIYDSTNPSTPLNARKIKKTENIITKPEKKSKEKSKKECKSSILNPSKFNLKTNFEEIKIKLLNQRNYKSDDESFIKIN